MIDRYQTPEMKALWSEVHKYERWSEVEALVLEAWEELGRVPPGLAHKLREQLKARPLDERFVGEVERLERETRHDVVAFTRALTAWLALPELERWLHLGLTSSDVVDTAQNLLLHQALGLVLAELKGVQTVLRDLAQRFRWTPAVARTHGVHAEPTSFGLRFLSFYAAFLRDEARIERARQGIGTVMLSGSVGNYAHLDPRIESWVARRLNLVVEPVSTQVVPRDRHAEVMAALALLGANVERVAVELRHLQRTEVLETQEPFADRQTGSSSMPHKKNPVALENLSGLARLLRSNLLAALEDVPLWHERDISHSSVERVILPDSLTLAHYMLRRLAGVLEGLVVREDRIERNLGLTQGLIYSQRVLDLLIDKGMDRTQAYEIVQRNALKCWEGGGSFKDLLEADPECPLKGDELDKAFEPQHFLRYVGAIYARFGL
jgi:adenylosuccinate lyase